MLGIPAICQRVWGGHTEDMSKTFDELAEAYEAMIDWQKRLRNEEPLYRWLFERTGAKRVLDAACGTGHHASMFRDWGLKVEGADVSGAMIERCRARWGQSADLRWVVRGFDAAIEEEESFDVATCVGNSLALAGTMEAAALAMRQLLRAVRRGGAVLIHVLNLWRLEEGVCQWQKCRLADLAGHQSLIIKGVHRCGGRGYVDLLVTRLEDQKPEMRSECTAFLGLEAVDLERMAQEGGAARVEIFGDYGRKAYVRQASQDLIVVAWK
jgi:SAM-dependent methyltransferase